MNIKKAFRRLFRVLVLACVFSMFGIFSVSTGGGISRRQEIEARKAEIRAIVDGNDAAAIAKLDEAELRSLNAELAEIDAREKRQRMAQDIATGVLETRHIDKPEDKPEGPSEAEKRGKALKENRSVTIASTGVILPDHQATDIKPTFNQVSSLVDRVNVKNLPGGESFKQPYSTGYGEAGYTSEANTPTGVGDTEATFDSATIGKTKIAAYAEDSEELIKLPVADYDGEVQKGISIAIRKKLNKEILIGDGAAGHFIGIFDDGATAIDASTDIELAEIDETTLDEIIYSFGGDENVEDISVLVLNKKDLKDFATLRDADGEKVYTIVNNGNTGTIDGIPFIINSNCKAVSADATTTGMYCMCYGPLSNYTMAIFSNIDITRSTDYKFKEGLIAHRGVVFAGGNVTAKNGFLRVKKK